MPNQTVMIYKDPVTDELVFATEPFIGVTKKKKESRRKSDSSDFFVVRNDVSKRRGNFDDELEWKPKEWDDGFPVRPVKEKKKKRKAKINKIEQKISPSCNFCCGQTKATATEESPIVKEETQKIISPDRSESRESEYLNPAHDDWIMRAIESQRGNAIQYAIVEDSDDTLSDEDFHELSYVNYLEKTLKFKSETPAKQTTESIGKLTPDLSRLSIRHVDPHRQRPKFEF